MHTSINMNKNTIDCWSNFFDGFRRHTVPTGFLSLPAIDIRGAEAFFTQYKSEYASFWASGSAINIWEVAGLKRDEVRNTAVLAWLLDCHGSHGQGNIFLKCFLDSLQEMPGNENAPALNIKSHHLEGAYRTVPEKVFLENAEDGQTNNRIDIVVDGNDFLLFIEAKIDAGEGTDQIERYNQIMPACAAGKPCGLVFLTRDGRADQAGTDGLATLSWTQFARSLEREVKRHIKEPDSQKWPLWVMPVLQFCQHIRTF